MSEILGNPLLIFALIGIISSIFNRIKKANEAQKNSKQTQTTTQNASNEETYRELEREYQDESELEKEKYNDSHRAIPANDVSDQITRTLETQRKLEKDVNRYSEGERKQVTASQKTRPSLTAVTKQRAIEGVIWSEVLGSPRAKRPYTTTRSYRYKKS